MMHPDQAVDKLLDEESGSDYEQWGLR